MTTDAKDDADPAVKPHVIDLEAEDVTVEPEAPAEAPPLPPPRRKSAGSARWMLAALIAGLAGGGWFYRDVLSSYFPTSVVRDLAARTATLEAGAKTTGEQLLAVSTAADQTARAATSLETAVKDAAAGAATAQTSLAELNQRLAATEKSLQSAKADLETLRAAIASGGV